MSEEKQVTLKDVMDMLEYRIQKSACPGDPVKAHELAEAIETLIDMKFATTLDEISNRLEQRLNSIFTSQA